MKHAMKWLLGLLIMLPVQPVFAHTGIETTVPADGETVTEAVDAVSLTFETPIEAGSRFSVTDAAGEAVRVNGITVEGDRLSGTVAEPLGDGTYTVDWEIIGEDGHVMTGTYSFSVDVPEQAATEAVTISAEANENEQEDTQVSVPPVTDAQAEAETDVEAVESESGVSPVMWLLVLAAAAGVAFLLMKKRR